jgi:hypothetical protein
MRFLLSAENLRAGSFASLLFVYVVLASSVLEWLQRQVVRNL